MCAKTLKDEMMKEMENMANATFSGTNVKKFQCLSMTKHSIDRIASFTHPQTDLSKSNPKDVRVQIKKNPIPNMGIWDIPDILAIPSTPIRTMMKWTMTYTFAQYGTFGSYISRKGALGIPFGSPNRSLPGNQPGPLANVDNLSPQLFIALDFSNTL